MGTCLIFFGGSPWWKISDTVEDLPLLMAHELCWLFCSGHSQPNCTIYGTVFMFFFLHMIYYDCIIYEHCCQHLVFFNEGVPHCIGYTFIELSVVIALWTDVE